MLVKKPFQIRFIYNCQDHVFRCDMDFVTSSFLKLPCYNYKTSSPKYM